MSRAVMWRLAAGSQKPSFFHSFHLFLPSLFVVRCLLFEKFVSLRVLPMQFLSSFLCFVNGHILTYISFLDRSDPAFLTATV